MILKLLLQNKTTTHYMNTITTTNFNFTGQKSVYRGKVREVYNINDDLLVMIATDRLSAFDVVLPEGIPYKGQILNQIATKFMQLTEDIVPNWLIATPDPNVAIGHLCEPLSAFVVGVIIGVGNLSFSFKPSGIVTPQIVLFPKAYSRAACPDK